MLFSYCTNIHPGESWKESFDALREHLPAVRRALPRAATDPLPLGLRLSAQAVGELLEDRHRLRTLRAWMEAENLIAYTINGFPYGRFHGTRVKENVYRPDWADPRRADYTHALFSLLGELLPEGAEGSVSTLPGSFKAFLRKEPERRTAILAALRSFALELDRQAEIHRMDFHLGLEPEPCGLLENSGETLAFFDQLTDGASRTEREALLRRLGVCYDTCHFAIAYEDPAAALGALHQAGIRLSKIHLSNALSLDPQDETAIARLEAFDEPTYLHQVAARTATGEVRLYEDLPPALAARARGEASDDVEWRVHFHIPVYDQPLAPLGSTLPHLKGTAQWLHQHPGACRHFEVETYTFGVLPESVTDLSVDEMLAREMRWCESEFFAS